MAAVQACCTLVNICGEKVMLLNVTGHCNCKIFPTGWLTQFSSLNGPNSKVVVFGDE